MSRRQILATLKSNRCENKGNWKTDDISMSPAMTAVIIVERDPYSYEVGDH